MAKKTKAGRMAAHVGRVSIIIAVLFLTVYLITIVQASSDFYSESAQRNATIDFNNDMDGVSLLAEEHYERLYEIVGRMEYATSKEDVDAIISSYIGSEEFGDLRYYSQGVAYSPVGDVVEQETSGQELILALSQSKKAGCTSVYFDKRAQVDCIAFFVPVRGSIYVDGILSIVPAPHIVQVSEVMQARTSMVLVIGEGGEIFSSVQAPAFSTPTRVGATVYDFIDDFNGDKQSANSVRDILSSEKQETVELEREGVRYTVVTQPIAVFDNHLHLMTLSVSDTLISEEISYIRHIVNILILAIIAFVVGLVFAFLFQKKAKDAQATANLNDSTIECPNVEGFRRNARNIVHTSSRPYAVVALAIRRYHFIVESFGQDVAVDILKFVSHVISGFCGKTETHGYVGEGKFLLLLDYTNEASFRDKLMIIENIINKYELLVENQCRLKLAAGVCPSNSGKRRTVSEMIDCATIVCEDTKKDVKMSYSIYTDNVRDKITRDEQIEAQMEHALDNNEFRLFLQPKYNVARDEVDSAEALARWFDPRKGDYIYPAEFISLFETNGFIIKLDHYIYLEVLKYLSSAAEKGDKVVPISVNVSRVTASSPDFVNFYVGNKKRYLIDDDLLTLEFTESFATEDHTKLIAIVNALHQGGIRCSVDDFGVGYSSFSVLKELPMDELKLDRLFLSPSGDTARDDKIISTIFSLATSMGMTVVQEGVETKEIYDRVVRMGIGVIQGYYYAKALPLEEFKIFIKSNTSIRYKAVVK
ncbi:MAG: EAL domain-containing protein [Clostridia bacterium]|nr:EAL domain-containing protein [Clostridia bacterium]